MDPTANLRKQLAVARRIIAGEGSVEENAVELAELVLALHEWMNKGGFPPEQWRQQPPVAAQDTEAAVFSAPECVFNYCPYSGVCQELGCQHKQESKRL